MGGHLRRRRGCAALLWGWLFALTWGNCVAGGPEGLFPPQARVVLLVGIPGDIESEQAYSAQLRSWLELASRNASASGVYVLCDDPKSAVLSNSLGSASALKADRANFLSLAQTLAGNTNPLVVVAWGHGGRQGNQPVFHVRGPRITSADFKEFALKAGAGDSRWVLIFRGSGAFASELAADRRQIVSSEGPTMFGDDPIGMGLLIKILREKPQLSFTEAAEELGQATEAWYADRKLARTEEPALWANGSKPRLLAVPLAEANALVSTNRPEAAEASKTSLDATNPSAGITTNELTAVWKELKRVDARNFPDADAVILRRRLNYTLGSSPAIAAEQEIFVQVLTPEGKEHGDFDVPYSPPHEDIAFDDCEVLRADGKLVRLDPDAIRESHEQAVGDYHRAQRKFFSLPGVAPGAVLHVRFRTTWKTFPMPHVSMEVPIRQHAPLVEESIQVSVPKDSAFHFAVEDIAAPDPAITQTGYATSYSWHFANLPAQPRELLAPPHRQARLLFSTFPDWAAFAEWYTRISQLTDQPTPEIVDTARALTRDAHNDRDKVLALYNYVTRLRYVAVPLGINSFRPHAAANVFKNQFGDCKDKANLFNTLLGAVDIKAHLVLVPRFTQAHDELPGLAFNHAISRVTLGQETLWIDTTDDVCRFGMLPPGDAGRRVLVIDGATRVLTTLPLPTPQDHRLSVRGEIDWTKPGDALPVRLRVAASGYPDYELRTAAQMSKERDTTMPLLAVKLRQAGGSFALQKQKGSSVAALNEEFTWQANGSVVGLVARVGQQSTLRAPFWLPREWDTALHARTAPLYLNQGYPLTLDEEFSIALPPGAQAATVPGMQENTVGPLRWRIEWTKLIDDKVVARMHTELVRGELSAGETAAFQQQLCRLFAALGEGLGVPLSP